MKLDYTIDSPQERKALVEKILAETPDPTPQYLEKLADYLVFCMEKQEKRQRKYLTENRLVTVNKRETSFEGLASQMENEDSIYNLISENKNTIFRPKISITQKDLAEIPFLRQVRDSIDWWKRKQASLFGRNAYIAKQAIIELSKEQYIIKNAYQKPVAIKGFASQKVALPLNDYSYVGIDGRGHPGGISLLNPRIITVILHNYSSLKQEAWGNFDKDLWALMEDFDRISSAALADFPLYRAIVESKIDGLSNSDVQARLESEFGVHHTVEYLSTLWRNKIPKLIASAAEDELLCYHFLEKARGQYKKCSKCGQIKLASTKYFSKNKTSKDGFYSICKICRNKGRKKCPN